MKPGALAIAMTFFGGFALFSMYWVCVMISRGEYLTAVVVLGCAMFCAGLVIPYVLVTTGKTSPRATFDAAGTTIQSDRIIEACKWVFLMGPVPAAAIFAIFWPQGTIDIPVPHSLRYSIPYVAAGMALMGLFALRQLFSGKARKYLRLTPNGFEFVCGPTTGRGQWTQVVDIVEQAPDTPAPTSSMKSITVFTVDGEAPTMPSAGTFAPGGGQAVRELMRFYWKHPDNRSELTDGRAIRRLETEEFDRR